MRIFCLCKQSKQRSRKTTICFNSLPNYKILELFKLKAFAGIRLNVAKLLILDFDRVENVVGKKDNADF